MTIGGNRVKPETAAINQVWRRKTSGTHFIVIWIGHALAPVRISTFTVETRKKQMMNLSTLLKRRRYEIVTNLVKCTSCKNVPLIRYGELEGEPRYHVGCDCLEFDGAHHFLDEAIRLWKNNMNRLDAAGRRSRVGFSNRGQVYRISRSGDTRGLHEDGDFERIPLKRRRSRWKRQKDIHLSTGRKAAG